MKKILALVIVAIMMLQASAIFANEITAYKFKPELDGVISAGEYPAESTMRVDKALVDSRQATTYNDYANGNMPADLYYDMSYAWDDENLYIAVQAIDKTPVPAQCWDITGTNGGTGRSDGFQINTFVNMDFGKWFMVTVGADGTVYTCGIYNQFPEKDDRQNFTEYVVGKGAWNENGYCFEIAIPWSMIELGNHFVDHSDNENNHVDNYYIVPWLTEGIEIAEGLEIAMDLCLQDVDANQNRGRFANDVFHGNDDPDGIRDYVVLAGEKPAADDNQGTTDDNQGTTDDNQGTTDDGTADDDQGTTDDGTADDDQGTTDDGTADDDQDTTDDGADTGADTGDDAAQTFDFGVIALVAALVSAAAVIIKKRR